MKNLMYVLSIILLIAVFSACKYLLFSHNQMQPVILPPVETVIMGDSHARHGLNPDYIEHSINISQDAQNIAHSYFVLQKLIGDGNRFSNLMLAVSYHSLGESYLNSESTEMMRRYHLVLDADFYRTLNQAGKLTSSMRFRYYTDNLFLPLGIINDYYEMTRINPAQIGSFPYIGDFEQNPNPKLKLPLVLRDSLRNSLKTTFQQNRNFTALNGTLKSQYHNVKGSQTSPILAMYLEKIAKLCNQNHIRLYLVSVPVHPEYLKRIPQVNVSDVDRLANTMEDKYGAVYLNFSDFPLEDKFFYDYNHITTPGSIIFSKYLNSTIKYISTGDFSYTP